ncbi:hypothetical protein ACFV3R_10790 [Streptomyces sp. NPDC059740]|uniref:hypothetical protein n=1 Tax=Streptomyces sp. NPDC059740 TaxID=3346926 RepID=UPI003658E7A3
MPSHPEHERAEILLPAMARALGRIRYLAEDLPDIADVLDAMDEAIAAGISIPVEEVPEATGTAKSLSESERALDALLSRALLKMPDDLTAGLPEHDFDAAMEGEFQNSWQKTAEAVATGELNQATLILQHTSYPALARIENGLANWAHCLEAAAFRRNPPDRT